MRTNNVYWDAKEKKKACVSAYFSTLVMSKIVFSTWPYRVSLSFAMVNFQNKASRVPSNLSRDKVGWLVGRVLVYECVLEDSNHWIASEKENRSLFTLGRGAFCHGKSSVFYLAGVKREGGDRRRPAVVSRQSSTTQEGLAKVGRRVTGPAGGQRLHECYLFDK